MLNGNLPFYRTTYVFDSNIINLSNVYLNDNTTHTQLYDIYTISDSLFETLTLTNTVHYNNAKQSFVSILLRYGYIQSPYLKGFMCQS